MSKKDLSLALNIDLATSGIGKLSAGITEIKKAGLEVADLENGISDLTHAFDDISNQQRLIEQFKSLKKESKQLNVELKKSGGNNENLIKRKKDLAQQLKVVRAEMDKAGISAKGLSSREKQLAEESARAANQLDKLTDEAKELKAIADAKIKLGIDTDDKARRELKEVTNAYNQLKKSGKLSSEELARANQLHTQKVTELENQLKAVKPTIADVRGELTQFAGAGAAFALMAREAMQFETAMTSVKKVVDGTPEQMNDLAGTIKQLAYELGMTAEQTAEIAAMGGQLGVAFDDLPKFTRLAGEMAVAFNLTSEEAGNAAAKMANVWGLPLEQVRELSDAINTLGNNTAAKESEITAAMLRIGGNAKQFGLAAEQAAALADAMIALGKPPEVAATAINALLLKLQTAEAQGDKFQTALGKVGYSAEQMAANIQANPQKALTDFIGKLGDMDKQARAVALSELFGAEYADDISLLVEGSDSLAKALELVADKTKTNGALQKEFAAQMDSSERKIAQAKTAISNLASTLGDTLLPVISTVAGGIGGIANAVNAVAETFPHLTQFAVILASGKLALVALNTTLKLTGAIGASSAGKIITSFTGAKAKIDATSLSASKFNAQMTAGQSAAAGLTGKIGGLVGKLSLLGAAFEGGWSIGTWLRENSEAAEAVGNEFARLIGYVDAAFTDRTKEQVDEYFDSLETGRETTERLRREEEKRNEVLALQKKRQEEAIAAAEAKKKADDANLIAVAEMRQKLQEMREQGLENTAAFRELDAQFNKSLVSAINYVGELKKAGKILDNTTTEARETREAFEAVGLSLNELTTGITDSEQKIIDGFGTAIDYINKTAASSKDAGDAMERYLVAAAAKIKSPEGLKALLSQLESIPNKTPAVETAIKAVEDSVNKSTEAWVELSGAIKKATNTQQIQEFKAKAKEAYESSNLSLKQYTASLKEADAQQAKINKANQDKLIADGEARRSTEKTTAKTKESTQATKEATEAEKEATEAREEAADAGGSIAAAIGIYIDETRKSLSESERAVEHFDALLKRLWTSVPSSMYLDDLIDEVAERTRVEVLEKYRNTIQEIADATDLLNSKNKEATYTLRDIEDAASLTKSSLYILNDESQLDGLNAAIDKARQKMADLAQTAKDRVEDYKAQLARLKGDDSATLELEHKRKLRKLEEELADAKAHQNEEQIQALRETIRLEKEIYDEKVKRYEEDKKREAEREAQREKERAKRKDKDAGSSKDSGAKDTDSDIDSVIKNLPPVSVKTGTNGLAQTLADKLAQRDRELAASVAEQVESNLVNQLDSVIKGRGI